MDEDELGLPLDEQVQYIEGKITMADGTVSEFSLSPDGTYGQWGLSTPLLGNRVAVIEAMREGLAEAGLWESQS